jgi:hypothetical protein
LFDGGGDKGFHAMITEAGDACDDDLHGVA